MLLYTQIKKGEIKTMTITTISNAIIIIKDQSTYAMRHNNKYWVVQIWDEYGGFITDMMISDCSPRTAWKVFYHTVRYNNYYNNGH